MTAEGFEDQVVIVTGATSGIGRVTSELFLQEGAVVVAVDIDEPGLSQLAAREDIPDHRLLTIVCDVADANQVERMVQEVVTRYGTIDVLLNNAGTEETDSVVKTTEAMWDRQMTVNVKSVFLCAKYVIPHMQKRVGSHCQYRLDRGDRGRAEWRSVCGVKRGGGDAYKRNGTVLCSQWDSSQLRASWMD